ncbi:DUF2141 domain-containing protein [Fibrisoma montanum]|uniref:DUF2141 domain-containing protein n=2 Tax=Fibrisoma montanum TaxID=2305895 RepID=A0A418LXA9_9BACT|nr:DUF2141 domain-containing protein [Fibrisoma montanum]
MFVFLSLLVARFVLVPVESPAAKATLLIDVQNVRQTKGLVNIALFKACAGFPECKPFDVRQIKPTGASVEATFSVEPGEYAVAVYHDANANGVLDKRMFGIPKEPYGFSNNFRPVMSAPKFSDCKIQVNADGKSISIKLN